MLGFPLLNIPHPSPQLLVVLVIFAIFTVLRQMDSLPCPTNYISAEEVCDWTGVMEAGLRVAERQSAQRGAGRKMAADVNPC